MHRDLGGFSLVFRKVPPISWVRGSRQGGAGVGGGIKEGRHCLCRGLGGRTGPSLWVSGNSEKCVGLKQSKAERPVEQDPEGSF